MVTKTVKESIKKAAESTKNEFRNVSIHVYEISKRNRDEQKQNDNFSNENFTLPMLDVQLLRLNLLSVTTGFIFFAMFLFLSVRLCTCQSVCVCTSDGMRVCSCSQSLVSVSAMC